MRICLVSRELAPFWGAGIGTYAANAAAAWAGAGHEVHLLCPPHEGLTADSPRLPRGVRLHTIDPNLSPDDLAPRPYEFQRYAMRVRRTLERLHAATPFEFIEFPDYWAEGHEAIRARGAENAFGGAVLCVRLHTPTHECRVFNEDPAHTTEGLALEHAEDGAIRDADLILSPTRSLLDLVRRRLGLFDPTPTHAVVPYPFDPAAAFDSAPPADAAPRTGAPEVLYFGRIERRKGVQLLVEAALSLLSRGSNASFRLIGRDTHGGPGSMLAHLRSLIPEQFGPRFTFEAARPRDQLPAAIRSAIASGGLCCFPSRWENFPNACLEAMALGAPVVASDAGGMAEIIEPGRSGVLFASGDATALAAAIERTLTDGALRRTIAQGAPARIAALCNPGTVIRDTLAAIQTARRHPAPPHKPLRIALVSREFAPFFGGGIGSYISQTCAILAAAGHEVHVITGPHENLLRNAPYLRPGVHFHAVDLDAGLAALDAYPVFPMRYAMAVHETLARLHAERAFDYIEFPDYHAEGYFAIRAKRTLGTYADAVLAVRTHSPSWLCRQADREPHLDLDAAQIEHLERAAVAQADAVISPSQTGLERIALCPSPHSSLSHLPVHAIIPCPIDIDELLRELGADSPSLREAAGAGSTSHGAVASSLPPTVLFFGKLQHLKGPHDLVAAAQILLSRGVRARFRLIGNDSPTGPFGRSMLDFLRSRIEPRFREAISFDSAKPRKELANAIREAVASGGLCCFPSHWESFPNVCLEAMVLGSPVVASDAGGIPAIIEHEKSGLLFPVGEAPAMAAAIERVLADRALRESLAAGAPARVRALCDPGAFDRSLRSLISRVRAAKATAAIESKPIIPGRQPVIPSLITALASTGGVAAPEVSVLVPFYNLGRYLPETLASLDAQTFRGFETIIINDGSTDADSVALLAELARTRPDLRIIHQPNRGLPATRNAGLRAARAPWVLPLDADDLIGPTLIEKALGVARAHPELAFVSPLVSYFVDAPDRPTGGWVPLGPDRDLLVAQNCAAAASGTLINRDAALAVGGYDETMTSYEDWDLWCKLAKSGHRGTVIPEFLLHYRVRPDSMYRTEATARHTALHAHILAQNPTLPVNPDRAMRLLASLGSSAQDARDDARAIISQNIRYRMADKVNDALKATGVQRAIKGLTVRVIGARNRRRV